MRTIHLNEGEKFNLVLHLGDTPTQAAHVRSFVGAGVSGMTLPDDDATGLAMPPCTGLTIRFAFDEALEPNDEPFAGPADRGAQRSAILTSLAETWEIDSNIDFVDLLNRVFNLTEGDDQFLRMDDTDFLAQVRSVHLTMQCEAAMAGVVKAANADPMRALEVLRAAGMNPEAPSSPRAALRTPRRRR